MPVSGAMMPVVVESPVAGAGVAVVVAVVAVSVTPSVVGISPVSDVDLPDPLQPGMRPAATQMSTRTAGEATRQPYYAYMRMVKWINTAVSRSRMSSTARTLNPTR